ncbi:MAG: metallophosphoesterase family protein [Vicingaceae bacterium]
MPKIKTCTIPKPLNGRRFAISDVHGCFKTFQSLLKQISLKKEDHLYLIGDLVNRGEYTKEVLDLILQLKSDAYQVYFIRGNHEQILINASKKSEAQRKRTLSACKAEELLDGNQIAEHYLRLLKDSFHYVDLEDFYLVHAGFDFSLENPFENKHQMLNIRNFKAKKKHLNGRKIVVGHTPKKLSKIISRIQKNKRKIYIDNGCVNNNFIEQGNLLCLNLDTLALSIQKNLD